jgi:Uma2 family endonuclease
MVALPVKRWTRAEYERLLEAEFLDSDRRYELIDGQIVEIMTQNPPHVTVVRLVEGWLRTLVSDNHFVATQAPIALDDKSEPEPDVSVICGRIVDYSARHPYPTEVELVVEVADSSIERDRKVKAPLYGRAGVKELWIVDVVARKLEIHREAGPDGYRVVTILAETEMASPLFTEDVVRVGDLLPPVGS